MILKKLILKEWFKSFFTAFLVLFSLVSVSQFIAELLRSRATFDSAVMGYVYLLPWLLNKILPVCCLVASLFSLNKLINHNELTAIFATGFTRKNFLITIFQASLLISLVQFINNGFFGPLAKHEKAVAAAIGDKGKKLRGEGLRRTFLEQGKFWYKSGDYFLSFGAFLNRSDVLTNVYLLRFNKDFQIKESIFAKKISYTKDKIWIFHQAKVITLLDQDDFPKVEMKDSLEVTLLETPSDFNQLKADISTLNFFDLKKYIDRVKKVDINTAEYEVIYLDMLASTVICIIFALLASIPLFYPNRRGNPFGKNLITVFVFTLIYWFLYSYGLELGKSSKMNVYVASFMVPGFFLLLLGGYFYRHRKLA